MKTRKCIAIVAQFPMSALDGGVLGRGGGQQATWLPQLAMYWESQNEFDIHWCVLGHKEKVGMVVRRWGQTFHLLPTTSITLGMLTFRFFQRLSFRRLFQNIKPDIVHCWGTENLYAASFLEFSGPKILSMQGIITRYSKIGGLPGWRWRFFEHWEPSAIRMADVVTCESQWGIDQVCKIAPVKESRVIEYGVYPSFYDVEWKPDANEPRFLFAGGLRYLKGVDILVEALRSCPDHKWKIAFAGAGPLKDDLIDLNDGRVELLGMLTTAELQREMSRAWALVLPSRADTSPNVVKEARVIGLPVIVSPNGGHAEYVESGMDGYIIDSVDPEKWIQAINCMASNFDNCKEMGSAKHNIYREIFRVCHTSHALLDLYREV